MEDANGVVGGWGGRLPRAGLPPEGELGHDFPIHGGDAYPIDVVAGPLPEPLLGPEVLGEVEGGLRGSERVARVKVPAGGFDGVVPAPDFPDDVARMAEGLFGTGGDIGPDGDVEGVRQPGRLGLAPAEERTPPVDVGDGLVGGAEPIVGDYLLTAVHGQLVPAVEGIRGHVGFGRLGPLGGGLRLEAVDGEGQVDGLAGLGVPIRVPQLVPEDDSRGGFFSAGGLHGYPPHGVVVPVVGGTLPAEDGLRVVRYGGDVQPIDDGIVGAALLHEGIGGIDVEVVPPAHGVANGFVHVRRVQPALPDVVGDQSHGEVTGLECVLPEQVPGHAIAGGALVGGDIGVDAQDDVHRLGDLRPGAIVVVPGGP